MYMNIMIASQYDQLYETKLEFIFIYKFIFQLQSREENMQFKGIIAATTIIAAALVSGCASINKAPASLDAEAKSFTTNTSHAQVYLYRNETLGAALSMPVTVNGKLAGSTGPHSFFKFNLPEGKHTFTSQGNESTLEIDTKNNKNYYIWQEVKMGVLSGGSKLQLVDEATGQAGVKECSMIQSELN
ncbi:hypothetical protein HNQ59_000852 [Chitinivorax tropicus]|uniref:DUF2846 domain-containing protein n=1 Tax=Chitinivorax tropicus TaxID=714531 RepID=A0A840MN19_9PROT|nr:DUF2846 domain-containing protein [Chitinivorax tropicus]MBB5017583.1 hypothetical protein [Chitinivorax tropicus]